VAVLKARSATIVGGILLAAWGVLHIAGGVWLRHDGSDPVVIPGWEFLALLLAGSVLTVAGGVAYLAQWRWGFAAGAVGVAWLWIAPVLFVALRFGWSSIDPLHHLVKLALSVVIIAVPALGKTRSTNPVART
jgi:hypothetical protein